MIIKVFDNPKTECRELWVEGNLRLALAYYDLDNKKFQHNDILSQTMSVGDWEAGKYHLNTEGINELVQKSRA